MPPSKHFTPTPRRFWLEVELQDGEVEPAIELCADLAQVARLDEPEALVQTNGCRVATLDIGQHHVMTGAPGVLNEFDEERPTDSATLERRGDVDRVFDRMPIAVLRTPRCVCRVSRDLVVFDRYQHRVTRLHASSQPVLA